MRIKRCNMSSKKKSRPAVPKTKTFTGCWTCRARKVKCDGLRPTCQRCQKGNHSCEGFDVRLYWITEDDAVAPSAIKRQAMTIRHDSFAPDWTFDSEEVDRNIARVEESGEMIRDCDGTVSSGPFSVFMPAPAAFDRTRHVVVDDGRCCSEDGSVSGSDSIVNFNRIDFQRYSTARDSTNVGSSNIQEDLAAPSPASSSSSSSSQSSLSSSKSPVQSEDGLQLLPALDPSPYRNSIIDILLNNYVFEVANILTPCSHPRSHYSMVYVPKALDGAAAVMTGLDLLGPRTPPSNIATFYTVLATSAFHLNSNFRVKETNLRFEVLASGYRGKAIKHLRRALQDLIRQKEDNINKNQIHPLADQSEAIISAMMSLITMDVVEGSMSEYQFHLNGVQHLANQIHRSMIFSTQTKRLLTICSFLTTISDSTSLRIGTSIPSYTGDSGYLASDEEVTNPDYCLELTYGITPTLFRFLRQVVLLSQAISCYATHDQPVPHTLRTSCIKISKALSQWSIEEESIVSDNVNNVDDVSLKIARHHIQAFWFGIRVYYHTRVLSCSSQLMSNLVNSAAHHLFCIEKIKRESPPGHRIGTTISWPGFIASCEAERGPPREIWYQWWHIMANRPIGNISRLWEVVQQAWRIKDDENTVEVPAWMPVLRSTRQRIIAV